MRAKAGFSAIALGAMLVLAGCSDKNAPPNLMNLRSSGTPDEFAIIPPKPLEMPASLAALPNPTPGGANRTDPRPLEDAILALGGRPTATATIPTADAALYAQGTRLGRDPAIRQTLATEDLQHRRKNAGRLLERWANTNTYFKAYADQSLDQHKTLEYWRSRGARTPSAPPKPKGN